MNTEESKKVAEYIHHAIHNLSFWKSYIVKEGSVSYQPEEETFSVANDFLIEKNGDNWDVQVWVSCYSNDNGYADSDYSTVGTFPKLEDAIHALLMIPVTEEMSNMAENYYIDKNYID